MDARIRLAIYAGWVVIAAIAPVLASAGIIEPQTGFAYSLVAIEMGLFVGIALGPAPFRIFCVGFLLGATAELAVSAAAADPWASPSFSLSWMIAELYDVFRLEQGQAVRTDLMWLAMGSGLIAAGVAGGCFSLLLWYKLGLNRVVYSATSRLKRLISTSR